VCAWVRAHRPGDVLLDLRGKRDIVTGMEGTAVPQCAESVRYEQYRFDGSHKCEAATSELQARSLV
jgi:hypothetical protein